MRNNKKLHTILGTKLFIDQKPKPAAPENQFLYSVIKSKPSYIMKVVHPQT